jgi:hypothetical protein
MSNDKSHSDKVPLEEFFREVFKEHKEPVEEKDFDQFLSKLEETGFFPEKKNTFLYGLIATLVILGGLISYYIWSTQKEDQGSREATSISICDTIVDKEEEHIGNQFEKENSVRLSPEEVPVSSGVQPPLRSDQPRRQPSVILVPERPASRQSVSNEPVIETKDSVETTGNTTPAESRQLKDSIRVKYIMQVDTIITTDSMNIKKRKWEKMKGKSK